MSTDGPSTGTALKRPRKPSASPMALRFITPLPSFMMHLQLLTLKQPGLSAGLERDREEEENTQKHTDSEMRPAESLILINCSSGKDGK